MSITGNLISRSDLFVVPGHPYICSIMIPQAVVSVVKRHFPRWKMSSVHQLALQICALDNGLRTGYLWDIAETLTDHSAMRAMLKDLRDKDLVGNAIHLVVLEMEVFLVNRVSLIDALKQPDRFIFLNLNDFREIDRQKDIDSLRRQLEESPEILNVAFDPTTCLATISGIIIDYPVVYYFDPQTELGTGGEALTVYCVKSACKEPLYSFSIPVIVLSRSKIMHHLKAWRLRIESLGLSVEERREFVNSWIL